MGKTIERLAQDKGHEIALKIDKEQTVAIDELKKVDVAIEFSRPEAAVNNLKTCIQANVPVVSGTTGWLEHWQEVENECLENKAAFFYASNFSIGVNIFFELNKKLAQLMNNQQSYQLQLEEIHHTQKLDAPSGTAITIAEGILEYTEQFNQWYLQEAVEGSIAPAQGNFPIISKREGMVPGTHIVKYESSIDLLEIKHEAKGREGFASGAILAAEWLIGKKGVFGMQDLLNL